MGYRVGVDIGGTFTDFCAFNEDTGELLTLKVLSRPDRPGAEVLYGIQQLNARYGISPEDISYFTHGTTVGVNTVIARKGIRLCLFATENFTDVLEVGRLKMPDPYDLHSRRPDPLVSRELVFPIVERIRSDGAIDTDLDGESVRDALAKAQARGAEGIVVALINSYRNDSHELAVKSLIAELAPDLPVYCSTEVWSIIREFERTTTAVIHGYVQPRVSHYLASLKAALRGVGVAPEPMVTKSNGGVMSAELGRRHCAQMILSGTASGVIGAAHVARASGFPDTMSLDIGGTSADVAFIREGQPQYGVGEIIGDYPIFIPSVAVTSIGAGGGSIARVDDLGVLKVGPDSAGSTPGPACYGRGGEQATITDAMVVLGYIGQRTLGYRAIDTDRGLARRALEEIGKQIGLSAEAAAQATIDVAISSMYLEVSKLMSRHGADPQTLSMQAFGGAGPMLACFLAQDLGIRHVIVPPSPGVLSALGGLVADIKNDFISTVFLDLDSAADAIRNEFASLEQRALHWLRGEQDHAGAYHFVYSADMRYRGQSFEIETLLDAGDIASGGLAAIANAFHAEHERVYEHADRDAQVQLINLRLVAVGESTKPHFAPVADPQDLLATPAAAIDAYINGRNTSVPLYERRSLAPGMTFSGPAVVAQDDCTTCIVPNSEVRVDGYGNLVIDLNPEAGAGHSHPATLNRAAPTNRTGS